MQDSVNVSDEAQDPGTNQDTGGQVSKHGTKAVLLEYWYDQHGGGKKDQKLFQHIRSINALMHISQNLCFDFNKN